MDIENVEIVGDIMTITKSNFCIGYTDQETLKLDFDGMKISRAKDISDWILERFEMGGYIILRSSKNKYHVVFDKEIDWGENCRIMGFVTWILKNHRSFEMWVTMQLIKKSSTLRISKKGDKPKPRIVYQKGTQVDQIPIFRRFRKMKW